MVWCVVWSSDKLCVLKWVLIKTLFSSDVDIGFGSGDGGGCALGVKDEVCSESGSSVDKYIKGKDYVDFVDNVGWGGVGT